MLVSLIVFPIIIFFNYLPCYFHWLTPFYVFKSVKIENTGLVSSRASLTSWGEGASLALVGHPSSDGVAIKIAYGVDVLH